MIGHEYVGANAICGSERALHVHGCVLNKNIKSFKVTDLEGFFVADKLTNRGKMNGNNIRNYAATKFPKRFKSSIKWFEFCTSWVTKGKRHFTDKSGKAF